MVADLDSRITSQLALHRGLHTLAQEMFPHYREYLLGEKLALEVAKQPPSLKVALALETLDRYNELAENIKPEERPWT